MIHSLRDLGWSPFAQSQLDLDELAGAEPVRAAMVHRAAVDVIGTADTRRAATGGASPPTSSRR